MLKTIIYIAIGGALGSVLRYLTSVLVSRYWSSQFPLATFLANILGCLVIGLVMGWLTKYNLAQSQLRWLLITGFCGGYTTFSTFGYENYRLLQNGQFPLALGYIALSVITGLLAIWIGLALTK